jgi:2-desacetyl-2-hydroxyethyl bacteriochlorophyllide A dehydrogenase
MADSARRQPAAAPGAPPRLSGSDPAVVFTEPRRVELVDRPLQAPGLDEVLLETSRSLISTGTELTVLAGEFEEGTHWAVYARYPFTPGYSAVGRVVAAGPGVGERWVGQRVAAWAPHAATSVVPVHALRALEYDEIPDEQATLFALGETALNGVRRSEVRLGEAVAVFGLGLVGQLVVRLCRLTGARPVLAVDPAPDRRALLPCDPGIVPIDPSVEDVGARAADLTRGRMVDVCFEATGSAALIPGEFATLRQRGRFVVLSTPRGGRTPFDFCALSNCMSTTIIGVHVDSHVPVETLSDPWTQRRHAELFFDLAAAGDLDLGRLITHRIDWRDAPDMYRTLLEDRSHALGVVLEWPPPTRHLRQ